MFYKIQLSRRAVLWLGVIAITAFILYLDDARYNNIDKNGIDYHLLEITKPCAVNNICSFRKFVEGIDLTVQLRKSQSDSRYIMTLGQASKLTRAILRVDDRKVSKVEKGVVSSEVKGRNFTKLTSGRWQIKNIHVESEKIRIKTILYVFTATAIYEIRQTISLAK